MSWYAVRTVYEHDRDADGVATFGETIVLFEAQDHDELFRKAEDHWSRCVALNPQFKRIGKFSAFALHPDGSPAPGTEVWCELFEGRVAAEDLFQDRYTRFAIRDDDPEA